MKNSRSPISYNCFTIIKVHFIKILKYKLGHWDITKRYSQSRSGFRRGV
jgi:hypothetical protein